MSSQLTQLIMNREESDKMAYRVIGCAMEVHSDLGNGFQEKVYQRALAFELDRAGVNYCREPEIKIIYKSLSIGTRRVDFLVADSICVEIKAAVELTKVHLAQAKNYLEAFKLPSGLLINFGGPRLEFKRLYLSPPIKQHKTTIEQIE